MSALVFERQQPLAGPAGDCGGDIQVSDAFEARWTARLSDGTYAVVTQTFYLVDFEGRRFIQSQVEYLACTDPADPGGTEIGSDVVYIDHTERVSDDPRVLAENALAPSGSEWREHRPTWVAAE